ncbi:MAG: hypothetical protein JWO19_6107 [Bryobacterales bacterium]|nr:hypothetical protein [Bryobacterales bacterium]
MFGASILPVANGGTGAATLGGANGVATLDGGGKLTAAQIPASLVGAVQYQGTWNATTNAPALVSSTGTKGFYYKVSVAGATAIDGVSQWNIGDTIIFDGATWDKIDGVANEVITVAGRFGNVVLAKADVGLGNVDNTSDVNKPVSTAQAAADALRALLAGGNAFTGAQAFGTTTGSQWNGLYQFGYNGGSRTGTEFIDSNATGGTAFGFTVNGAAIGSFGATNTKFVINAVLGLTLQSGNADTIVLDTSHNATFQGAAVSISPTAGVGYATGAGGTVVQATSKATGVTLNKVTGLVTMNAAALAAGAIVSFAVTNSALAATDQLVVTDESGGTLGGYGLNGRATGAGAGAIDVINRTAGSLSEAVVLRWSIIKSVNA